MLSGHMKGIATTIRRNHSGRRLVLVSGNFNLVHPGHVRLLNFARSCGDSLVVALLEDGEPGVAVPKEVREEALLSMSAVDNVVVVSQDELLPFILELKPQLVVKGKEHESGDNPEKVVVKSYGGQLIFSSGESSFSYSDVIRYEREHPVRPQLFMAREFCKKHGITNDLLRGFVEAFRNKRMLVLGDLILDEYIDCEPLGMSQEDPTIVVSPAESKRYVGGAGIVAAHLVGLGASVRFLTLSGDDAAAETASSALEGLGINHVFVRDQSRPTILKQRFRAAGKTLLRVSHLRSHDAGEEQVEKMFEYVKKHLPGSDLVVFSDFNYGSLPQNFVDFVRRHCLDEGIPFVADSQASSQVGDVSRFKRSTMMSATEREARLAVHDFKSGLQNVANTLLAKSEAQSLIIKLGGEGCLIVIPGPEGGTSNLHAFNRNPVDVAGAGDAMLAAACLAVASGANAWESAYLGSIASGLQVSRVGNLPLQRSELLAELN